MSESPTNAGATSPAVSLLSLFEQADSSKGKVNRDASLNLVDVVVVFLTAYFF